MVFQSSPVILSADFACTANSFPERFALRSPLAATIHSPRAPLMFDSKSVSDVCRFHSAAPDSNPDQGKRWGSDGERIVEWQVQLVDFSESISEQLTQIHSGLNAEQFPQNHQGVELRIVSVV